MKLKLGGRKAKLDIVDLGITAAGAAFSSTVVGYVAPILPGVTEDILEMLVGGLIWYFTTGYISAFGKGILIAGLSKMIAAVVPQFGGTVGQVGRQPRRTQRRMREEYNKYNVGI